jgi:hypothetical protein
MATSVAGPRLAGNRHPLDRGPEVQMRWLIITVLGGCGGTQAAATCAQGFLGGTDGLCYQITADDSDDQVVDDTVDDTSDLADTDFDDVHITDLLDQVAQECTTVPAGDALDFVNGCASNACAGMTYVEMNAALSEDGICEGYTVTYPDFTYSNTNCEWRDGEIKGFFDDDDNDGVPDAEDTTYAIYLNLPYTGSSPKGLGLGASMGCFLQEFGTPEGVSFEIDAFDYMLERMEFADFVVYDYRENAGTYYDPDGLVDRITLYTP